MARELDEPVDKAPGEHQPEREAVEERHGVRPTDEDEQAPDIDEAQADDFAARNVTMSNALPGGASPYAGALIGRSEDFIEPTDQEAEDSPTDPRPR